MGYAYHSEIFMPLAFPTTRIIGSPNFALERKLCTFFMHLHSTQFTLLIVLSFNFSYFYPLIFTFQSGLNVSSLYFLLFIVQISRAKWLKFNIISKSECQSIFLKWNFDLRTWKFFITEVFRERSNLYSKKNIKAFIFVINLHFSNFPSRIL